MVKITTLVENTSRDDSLEKEHGLSLYIETSCHKLLFDVGASDRFLRNAKRLGIDISQADTLVISHGHYDHGGGLEAFLDVNKQARIYIHREAFLPHYSQKEEGWEDISLPPSLKDSPRITFVEEDQKLDGELALFTNVRGRILWPASNGNLKVKTGEGYAQDEFGHEQNLVITDGTKKILIAGCAHNGIINILEQYKSINGSLPDLVVGGLHLMNPRTGTVINSRILEEIGERLYAYPCRYAVCHCTGEAAYEVLREKLGDRIRYIRTGDVIS